MTKIYDEENIYCPKLGHYLTFKYCRREGIDNPCPKIISCWHGKIPVAEYLNENYPEIDIDKIRRSKSKLASILEIVEKSLNYKKS